MHKVGFVFGKFYPPHLGHLELINYAGSVCEHLIVLVCVSIQECIPPATRQCWISASMQDSSIEVRIFLYDEAEYPNTSVSSRAVSRQWAEAFRSLVPDATLLVTSEPYGEYVADFMGITHMPSQPPRSADLVSGTTLRADMLHQWRWLVPGAKSYFQKTVVISGTESTGKSTLARFLTERLGATLVSEAGRDIVPDSNSYNETQLREITARHAHNIAEARKSAAPLVIVDTDIYVTQSYAKFAMRHYLELPAWIYADNHADLRIYLAADAPYHQDGTRLGEDMRNQLDCSHRQTLQHFGQHCLVISGDYESRQKQALLAIKALFDVEWRMPATSKCATLGSSQQRTDLIPCKYASPQPPTTNNCCGSIGN